MAPRNALPHHARSASIPGSRGVATVTSALLMRAPAQVVYAFLSRLPNHGLITGRRLRLESVTADGTGARIAMRGPLGIRRTARTRVTDLQPPRGFGGTAAVGRRTEAYVQWTIERAGTGSLVTLTATILRAGAVDRLLLALGGRHWLAHSFDRALALLAVAVESTVDTGEPYARLAG
jgi:Polyketide cyclase / dehydrase and lipid transport